MRFMSVDFPDPEGPMMATNSLRTMVKETPAEGLDLLGFELVGLREVLDRDDDVVRGGHGHCAFFSSDLIRIPSLSSRRAL